MRVTDLIAQLVVKIGSDGHTSRTNATQNVASRAQFEHAKSKKQFKQNAQLSAV